MRTINPDKIDPTAAGSLSNRSEVLTAAQVSQWREQGFLLIDGIFPQAAVDATVAELNELTMTKAGSSEFEVGDGKTFPSGLSNLDALSLDKNLVGSVQQLLGCDEVRMSQAETWKKVAVAADGTNDRTYSNQDQRIHMDFPNHTLLHPPPWYEPEAVAVIIYLSDSSKCGGATRVVPRLSDDDELYQWPYSNMPGFGAVPWTNDRHTTETLLKEKYPEMAAFRAKLYEREQSITFSPGTVLLYRHDIWHRGTPLLPGAVRFVQNLVFKRPNCDWLNNWNKGTAYSMYFPSQYVEKLIARLTMKQRNCLGIPLPGHPYWTALTVEAVRQRYEVFGFNIEPYRTALQSGE